MAACCVAIGAAAVLLASVWTFVVTPTGNVHLVAMLVAGQVDPGIAGAVRAVAALVLVGALWAAATGGDAWPLGLTALVLLAIAAPTTFHLVHLVEASAIPTRPGPAVLGLEVGAGLLLLGTVVGFVVAGEVPPRACSEGHLLAGSSPCTTCAQLAADGPRPS